MKQIENFRFNDLVLYCKGWYEAYWERTSERNNKDMFFADLERAIKMNKDYWYPDKMSKDEVIGYLLKALDLIYTYLDDEDKRNGRWLCSHKAFRDETKKYMSLYNIDEEYAIALMIHGILQCMSKDEIKLNKPVYKRGSWRLGRCDDKPSISMTYKYMNSRASKMFDKD
jgi:hypothetical protein